MLHTRVESNFSNPRTSEEVIKGVRRLFKSFQDAQTNEESEDYAQEGSENRSQEGDSGRHSACC